MRLYCNKQLETTFHQFCEKPLHITFKATILSLPFINDLTMTFYVWCEKTRDASI